MLSLRSLFKSINTILDLAQDQMLHMWPGHNSLTSDGAFNAINQHLGISLGPDMNSILLEVRFNTGVLEGNQHLTWLELGPPRLSSRPQKPSLPLLYVFNLLEGTGF